MKSERVALGAAIALLSASWHAPAFAAACTFSDSLQLGTQAVQTICEESGEGISNTPGRTAVDSISFTAVAITKNGGSNPLDFQVTLTEPGGSAVSDFVNIDPTFNSLTDATSINQLDVTLVSDTAVPLAVGNGNAVIPETGGRQNLDSLIKSFYGISADSTIPTVIVVSDVEVPEPSTWAIMLVGFAWRGFAGHRRARKGAAF